MEAKINPEDRNRNTVLIRKVLYGLNSLSILIFFFAIDTIRSIASKNPEWKQTEPCQALIEGNLEKIIAVSHANMAGNPFSSMQFKVA
ncbi:MAG: hypothetical protein BGO14_00195 [Chlamydiales bacterium 38-26]|nr:MAG: hypothetical protein BGO14_00195 [Chlamydiales bacterium 38-26]